MNFLREYCKRDEVRIGIEEKNSVATSAFKRTTRAIDARNRAISRDSRRFHSWLSIAPLFLGWAPFGRGDRI